MDDNIVRERLPGIDFIAAEIHYHFPCLTSYRNKYRDFIKHKHNPDEGKLHYQQCKSAAFHELFLFIANELRNGISKFSRQELKTRCEDSLRNLGYEVVLHRDLFSSVILEKFEDFGVKMERGWSNMFIFPEDAKSLLDSDDMNVQQDEHENLIRAASTIRNELLSNQHQYNGNLISDCPLPRSQSLVSMILYGTDAPISSSKPTVTLSQLLLFNVKSKATSSSVANLRHHKQREPPISVYLGLKIHCESRNKSLVEIMHQLGLCLNYHRVLEIEDLQAHNICDQFENDGVVCPRVVQKNAIVLGALDNIDHNPSSTTSEAHLHGSAISLMQPSTSEISNRMTPFKQGPFEGSPKLPEAFCIVPATALNNKKVEAPPATQKWTPEHMDPLCAERKWMEDAMAMLERDVLHKNDNLAWSAYHASNSSAIDTKAVVATLPLFFEKADSAAMVKHSMILLQKVTDYINPGQVPVLACDQPIFAQAKFIQWKWPEQFKNIFIMFGGMHIEKALWSCVGDMLESSGWETMLIQAGIAESGTADAYLKGAHICRTRRVHQITALALFTLQKQAFQTYIDNCIGPSPTFEIWKLNMMQYPTFRVWNMIIDVELAVLSFVRSIRLGDFDLYISCLQKIMHLFFALDHQNYSRWLTVHINDILSADSDTLELLRSNWTLNKRNKRFSNLPLDQVHEQQNAIIKGKGGVVGLTQNQSALNRWMTSGPEIAKMIDDFEHIVLQRSSSDGDDEDEHLHHSETLAEQKRMQNKTNSLIDAVNDFGNPFEENHEDLLTLDTHNCASTSVISSFDSLQSHGQKQYDSFLKKVLQQGEQSIHDPIKKNMFELFKAPKKRKKTTTESQKLRNSASLFGRMYLANQHRQGDPLKFFSYENQLDPPSISVDGCLRKGNKSKLLDCIGAKDIDEGDINFDCHIIDGGTLLNTLTPAGSSTFLDFATKVFIGHLKNLSKVNNRLDLVWDEYHDASIKSGTRTSRGTGARRKVTPKTRLPTERAYSWSKFLRNSDNKVELIKFLNSVALNTSYFDDKWVNVTQGTKVESLGVAKPMDECFSEEADAKMFYHIEDALACGFRRLCVRSVDSDIVYNLIGQYDRLVDAYPDSKLVVGFGTGRHYRMLDVNKMALSLTRDIRIGLPAFHDFSGGDCSSFFYNHGKITFWKRLKSYPDAIQAFKHIAEHPFMVIDEDSPVFKVLERFVVVVYDSGSEAEDVNLCRLQLFARKQDLDCIPPTKNALMLHSKRSIYQTGKYVHSTVI